MIISEKTLGEIVTENYKIADVFSKYGLDFCCGGKTNIVEACSSKAIDFIKLSEEIADTLKVKDDITEEINSFELDDLIDYILINHHEYIRKEIPPIKGYLEKITRVHGNNNPNLKNINGLFNKISDELLSHIFKEEQILFPYIKNIVASKNGNNDLPKSCFGNINNPIRVMLYEHETAGNDLKEMDILTENYTIPDYACNSYKIAFQKLKDFNNDLLKHVHLENNILFPKAIKLYEEINLEKVI